MFLYSLYFSAEEGGKSNQPITEHVHPSVCQNQSTSTHLERKSMKNYDLISNFELKLSDKCSEVRRVTLYLIVRLLTLYKLPVNIQLHINSVSINIQHKCVLTVSIFCCNRLLTKNQLTICTLNQHFLSRHLRVDSVMIKSMLVIYS